MRLAARRQQGQRRGKGDLNKIEKLKREQILKAGQFFTAADFAGQADADVEDLFDPEIFAQLLGVAYAVPRSHEAAVEKRGAADPATLRIAKQAEALFKLMPLEVPEFGHSRAAEWLMRNPRFLDGESEPVSIEITTTNRVPYDGKHQFFAQNRISNIAYSSLGKFRLQGPQFPDNL